MRTVLLMVAGMVAAANASAATVVLKGGKQLEVASLQRQGNYFVVKQASGRVESYPVAAVDLDDCRIVTAAVAARWPMPAALAARLRPGDSPRDDGDNPAAGRSDQEHHARGGRVGLPDRLAARRGWPAAEL